MGHKRDSKLSIPQVDPRKRYMLFLLYGFDSGCDERNPAESVVPGRESSRFSRCRQDRRGRDHANLLVGSACDHVPCRDNPKPRSIEIHSASRAPRKGCHEPS